LINLRRAQCAKKRSGHQGKENFAVSPKDQAIKEREEKRGQDYEVWFCMD
jgi:hypothetical protein